MLLAAAHLAVAAAAAVPVAAAGTGGVRGSAAALALQRLGPIDYMAYESTPLLFRGRLLLMETITLAYPRHISHWDRRYANCSSYFRVRETTSGTVLYNLTESCGHSFGSAFVDDAPKGAEKLWVFGTAWDRPNEAVWRDGRSRLHSRGSVGWGGLCSAGKTCVVAGFSTDDPTLQSWTAHPAVLRPGAPTFNVDVTRVIDPRHSSWRYIMVVEQSAACPNGNWTSYFYVNRSPDGDLSDGWERLDSSHVLGGATNPTSGAVDSYWIGACPTIRFVAPYFYVLSGGQSLVLTRTMDLRHWEAATVGLSGGGGRSSGVFLRANSSADTSPCGAGDGCMLRYSPTAAEAALLAAPVWDTDVSDPDLVQLPGGKATLFWFLFGNQRDHIFAALARAELSMAAWFESHFAQRPPSMKTDDAHLIPSYHWFPDTVESQDISGPIKINDRWHVFVDCIPEGSPGAVTGQAHVPLLQWCHFSSLDLVHFDQHPIAIRNDREFDNVVAQTGAVFQHPNGTVMALYSTINSTSLNGTVNGNICLAVALDSASGTLLRWRKICNQPNGAIINPTCHWCRETCPLTCKQNENSTRPSPFAGIVAKMGHMDPTAAWLDVCTAHSSEHCWYVLVASGGRLPGKGARRVATLWRTDYAISTNWSFVRLFFDSSAALGRHYSCPDLFALPKSDSVAFGALDWTGQYQLGTYTNGSVAAPMFKTDTAPVLGMSTNEIWKTGGEGPNNALDYRSRRVMWGAIVIGHSVPNLNPMSAYAHFGKEMLGTAPAVVSLPRDLSLLAGSPSHIGFAFVPELQQLRRSHTSSISPVAGPLAVRGRAVEIFAEFDLLNRSRSADAIFGLSVLVGRGKAGPVGTRVGYNAATGEVFLGASRAKLELDGSRSVRLHIYVDASLVEAIVNNRTVLSQQILTPNDSYDGLAVFGTGTGTSVNARHVDVWELAGIWQMPIKHDDDGTPPDHGGWSTTIHDLKGPPPPLRQPSGLPSGFYVLDPAAHARALHGDSFGWAVANAPFVDFPDMPDVEAAYYYRWRVFHRHLIATPAGWVITEFQPKVGWAGRFNTIPDAAGHHIMEGRWAHNASFVDDYLKVFFLLGGSPTTTWRTYTAWFAWAAWQRHLVRGDSQSKAFLTTLFPKLLQNLRSWNATHRSSYGGRWCWWQSDGLDAMEVSISGSGCRPTLNSVMWGEASALLEIAALAGETNTTLIADLMTLQSQARAVVLDQLWNPQINSFAVIPLPPPPSPPEPAPPPPPPMPANFREVFRAVFCCDQLACPQNHTSRWLWAGVATQEVCLSKCAEQGDRCNFITMDQTKPVDGYVKYCQVSEYCNNTGPWAAGVPSYAVTYANTKTPAVVAPCPCPWGSACLCPPPLSATCSAADLSALRPFNTTVHIRELLAFVPWYFAGLIPASDVSRYEGQWSQLFDLEGFQGKWGLRTAERRNACYNYSDAHHDCWNGPSWPFESSRVLTAAANLLHDHGSTQTALTFVQYATLLTQYARQHTQIPAPSYNPPDQPESDPDKRPLNESMHVYELLHPDEGYWIDRYRTAFCNGVDKYHNATACSPTQDGPQPFHDIGVDYFHSSYVDLVLSGLVGIRPRANGTVVVSPLLPATTRHFAVDHVLCHGQILSIFFDRDGSRYGRGPGLNVLANGNQVAHAPRLQPLRFHLPAPDPSQNLKTDDKADIESSQSTATPVKADDVIDAYLTHATQKIFHTATPPPPPAGTVPELVAARNEYEPLLVVLKGPATYTAVSAAVPSTAIQYRAACVGYVSVVNISDCDSLGPGSYPDPLIPEIDSYVGQTRNAFPISVPQGENRLLLIDLFVPPGTTPGDHAGSITLTTKGATKALPFKLQVFGHTLPSSASMQSRYGMGQGQIFKGHHMSASDDSPAHRALYTRYLEAGLMHRISGADDRKNYSLVIELIEKDGSFVTGRTLPFGLSGAKLTSVQMPCSTLDGLQPYRGCPVFAATNNSWTNASTAWTAAVTKYWAAVLANFSKFNDGRERLLYDYSLDEPTGAKAPLCVLYHSNVTGHTARNCTGAFQLIKARAAALHAVDPNLRSLVTTEFCGQGGNINGTCNVPMGLEDVKDDINLFVPMVQYVAGREKSRYAESQWPCSDVPTGSQRDKYNFVTAGGTKNNDLWWYQACFSEGGCAAGPQRACTLKEKHEGFDGSDPCLEGWPSFMIDHPAVRNRVLQWATFRYDVHGELLWSAVYGFHNPGGHNCNGTDGWVSMIVHRRISVTLDFMWLNWFVQIQELNDWHNPMFLCRTSN
jgi:sucrose-6-phosphate hydrolase SacC (GH32 family)